VKIIKAIMVFVLLALAVSVFLYLNNTDNTNTSDTSPQVDKYKEINKERPLHNPTKKPPI
jgi:uncharacterized membrane protein